jgi:hypothetical protein
VTSLGEPTNWAINIANIFLAPFGLGSSDSSVSAEGTKGDLLQLTQKRLPQGVPVHVACRDSRCVCLCTASQDCCSFDSCYKLFTRSYSCGSRHTLGLLSPRLTAPCLCQATLSHLGSTGAGVTAAS